MIPFHCMPLPSRSVLRPASTHQVIWRRLERFKVMYGVLQEEVLRQHQHLLLLLSCAALVGHVQQGLTSHSGWTKGGLSLLICFFLARAAGGVYGFLYARLIAEGGPAVGGLLSRPASA